MNQTTLKDQNALRVFTAQFAAGNKKRVYALNANESFRSAYLYTVGVGEAADLYSHLFI